MSLAKQHQRWKMLKVKGPTVDDIPEILSIDSDTPWVPREPDWWLEMMQVYRSLLIKKHNLKTFK